jgi:hypothetical protein
MDAAAALVDVAVDADEDVVEDRSSARGSG